MKETSKIKDLAEMIGYIREFADKEKILDLTSKIKDLAEIIGYIREFADKEILDLNFCTPNFIKYICLRHPIYIYYHLISFNLKQVTR